MAKLADRSVAIPAAGAADWALLGVLVVIWGSAFAALKIAVVSVTPMWMVTGRLALASLLLFLMLAAFGAGKVGPQILRKVCAARPPSWAGVRAYSLVGVAFTAVPFVFYAEASETLTSPVLAICNGGVPIFTAVFAHLLLSGEALTPRRTAGVLLGFSGLAVLVAPALAQGATANLAGLALAIVGAALYSGGNITTRQAPPVAPVMSSLIITLSGLAVLLPMALVFEPFPVSATPASLLAVGFLGLAPTALGTILYVILIQRAGAVFVSFATYMTPLWASVLGVTFLNEPLRLTSIAALVLILAGVAVASRKRKTAAVKAA